MDVPDLSSREAPRIRLVPLLGNTARPVGSNPLPTCPHRRPCRGSRRFMAQERTQDSKSNIHQVEAQVTVGEREILSDARILLHCLVPATHSYF
jgi:hypothetical protein